MMANSFQSWRKRNTARNSYIYSLFLIGLPFTPVGTYFIYQIQVLGNLLGSQADGSPCVDYCLIPFGSNKQMDLNSAILYLNAIGLGVGGACSLLISAYADYWSHKTLLVASFIVVYGVLAVPGYWLRELTATNLNALMALYALYAIVTYILSALINIFIPHCMRQTEDQLEESKQGELGFNTIAGQENAEDKMPASRLSAIVSEDAAAEKGTPRRYGFVMSILGGVGVSAGGLLTLIIIVILARTLPSDTSQSAGLLMTTVVGFITIAGSIISYIGLPQLQAKSGVGWKKALLGIFLPFVDLIRRKNMLFLLLSYTIFVDTALALSSVTGQLFFIEVHPDVLEITLYSIANVLFAIFGNLAFLGLQSWKPKLKLESWLLAGYALRVLMPVWGCVGFADVSFGMKNRWEFYVLALVQALSDSIANSVWRVLFSEFVPEGQEIQWFGLQVVLSCATSWINYVTSAPLQDATHQLRFPLVLCLIFLVIPVIVESLRLSLGVFARDRERWQRIGASPAHGHVESSKSDVEG